MRRRFGYRAAAAAILMLAVGAAVSARAEIELFSGNPLMAAIRAQNVQEVEGFAVRGEHLEAVDAEDRTPIIYSALIGNAEIVEILIKHRVRINHKDKLGNSALFYAAGRDDHDSLELLLTGGADPNIENRQGLTPLMTAAANGAVEAVRILLDRKADATRRDYTGRTALMWAEWNRRRDVVSLMRNAGVRE